MTEAMSAVPGGAKLPTHEVRKVAGGAAAFGFLLAAIGMFVGSGGGGLVAVLIVALLIGVATGGVFLWAVPWATTLEEPGASVVGLVASLVGVVTVVIFWSGLPPVFACAGIVLAWPVRDEWVSRMYARAAIALGVAALVLYVVVFVVSLF